MNPNQLFLSCSHSSANLGLKMGSEFIFKELPPQHPHSESLFPALLDLLRESGIKARDLTGVVVDQGPGSFTGVRLAIAVSRSLCFGLNIKGIPMLSFWGHIPASMSHNHHTLWVALNAFRNGIYLWSPLAPDDVKLIDLPKFRHWLKQLPQSSHSVLLLGDAIHHSQLELLCHENQISFENTRPHVANMHFHLNHKSYPLKPWNELLPFYFRPSAAEENFSIKNSQS